MKKICDIFHFQLVVDHCEIGIKSIELQLVRVETCGCAEGYARDGKYNKYFMDDFCLEM